MDKLADMTNDLVAMFEKYGYKDASCFGHALEGNLHLVFSQVSIPARQQAPRSAQFVVFGADAAMEAPARLNVKKLQLGSMPRLLAAGLSHA